MRCKVVSVLCVQLFFYKHMPKTNSSWKPGFEKNLNFYYTTFLPAKYVHFSMEKNHTNLQYVSMATKKNHQWKPSLLRHGSAPRNFWFRAHDRFVQVADPKKWTFKKRDEF